MRVGVDFSSPFGVSVAGLAVRGTGPAEPLPCLARCRASTNLAKERPPYERARADTTVQRTRTAVVGQAPSSEKRLIDFRGPLGMTVTLGVVGVRTPVGGPQGLSGRTTALEF